MEDAYQHSTELSRKSNTSSKKFTLLTGRQEEYGIMLDLKFDNARQFFIRIAASELEDRPLPPVFTNVFRKKSMIECQTLELMKRNQKERPVGDSVSYKHWSLTSP